MELTIKTLSLNGRPLKIFHPVNDDTIFGTINCLQSNRFHLQDIVFKDGDVVVDIGCNVGLVSLVAAALYPQIRVYAFDASAVSIAALRHAAAANQLPNIQAFQVAVGANDARDVQFFSNGKDVSCLVEAGLNSSNPVLDSTVNKISIDTIFDSPLLGINRVAYLKMDIEGGEFEIFKRLFAHRMDILNRIDLLHMEIHPYPQYNPEQLRTDLQNHFGSRVFFDT